MDRFQTKKIVILEMANNHMGDVGHGIKLIETFGEICKNYPQIEFIFKLQYRDLDSFVHPAYKERTDLKFIKRFEETKLTQEEFGLLIESMRKNGFKTMATPFDNASVPKIVEQKLDYIKIASCSFGDWPLLEDIAKVDMPIIASTAGATLQTIDSVVSFFQHRDKEFMLMHCVGEYPTPKENMQLNQMDLMQKRYEPIEIGLSTHEDPNNTELVKMAVAKGVKVYEKHVGLPTQEYTINGYSASPKQLEEWLKSMSEAYEICGDDDTREIVNKTELKTLRDLRRGVVAKDDLKSGTKLSFENTYLAFPPEDGQLTANDWSKYKHFTLKQDVKKDKPISLNDIDTKKTRSEVWDIVQQVKELIKRSGVVVPNRSELEISHHYGIDKFHQFGISMITVVNREYCKKLIIILPGQTHPEQYHKRKEETFHLLYGDLELTLNGDTKECKVGDVVVVEPMVKHRFSTKNGAIIEEISSAHIQDDSYYNDEAINKNKNRKTFVAFWNN